jgi:indolepyruvate ferredoxin oxidoreductase beta subunit
MTMNIYITGVGGQGIGMLSEALIRAADHAGLAVKGVDTHGLAQRGGIVVSHLRVGGDIHSPLIPEGQADIAVALERHEALRSLNGSLKDGGTLVWYDTVWQPLEVRVGTAPEVAAETIAQECSRRKVRNERVRVDDLPDTRMQNIALLAAICKKELIPGVKREHYEAAMGDLMDGKMLEKNRELFVKLSGRGR